MNRRRDEAQRIQERTDPDFADARVRATFASMILALRILYFEDLSVGMTEF